MQKTFYRRKYALVLGLCLMAAGSSAQAQMPGDLELSQESLIAIRERIETQSQAMLDDLSTILSSFSDIDTDGSGTLTLEELIAFSEESGIVLPMVDRRPGPVSDLTEEDLLEEIATVSQTTGDAPPHLVQLLENFATADTDQDGVLTVSEQRAYAEEQGTNSGRPPRGRAPEFPGMF